MKQLLTMILLAMFALGTPISGYSQDSKAKAEDKSKQDAKAKPAAPAKPDTTAKQDSKAKAEDKSKSADKAKAADTAKATDKGKSAGEIIDINTATAAQLMTLDGIGDARAAAIIKGRPYRAKNQLVSQKILPEAVYEPIKEKMIAKQAPAKK